MKNSRTVQNIVALVLVVAALVCVKLALGTRSYMYLSAGKIDHVEVTQTAAGLHATTTGDDTARLVNILRKTVLYGAGDEIAGDSIELTIYNKDGSTMEVRVGQGVFETEGQTKKGRAADSDAIAEWAAALPTE